MASDIFTSLLRLSIQLAISNIAEKTQNIPNFAIASLIDEHLTS